MSLTSSTFWLFLKSSSGQTVALILSFFQVHLRKRYLSPPIVFTNHGPEFLSVAWKNALTVLRKDHVETGTYSLKLDSYSERTEQTIRSIKTRISMNRVEEWNELLQPIVNNFNEEKEEGEYIPYEIMFSFSSKPLLSAGMAQAWSNSRFYLSVVESVTSSQISLQELYI